MRRLSLAPVMAILLIVGVGAITSVSETIPGIIVGSSTAMLSCASPVSVPATVSLGSTGFVMVTCPSTSAAIVFRGTGSETPTFTAPIGESVTLMQMGYACSFSFNDPNAGHLTGQNLTSLVPVTFSSTYSNTTLYSGGGMGYNYCLYYSNIGATGLPAFTISWSP